MYLLIPEVEFSCVLPEGQRASFTGCLEILYERLEILPQTRVTTLREVELVLVFLLKPTCLLHMVLDEFLVQSLGLVL